MKTLLSLLTILSLMFINCSASSVESDEDNKIADRPITPKEMQRMMGRGFDVQWAEFSKKYWHTGTEEEMQNICDIINLGVEWQERTGIPTWIGAWMPGNYNKGDDYTVEEQCVFASFMKSELERYDLPWAVNSLDKFYDIYNNCWYDDMQPLIDVLAK